MSTPPETPHIDITIELGNRRELILMNPEISTDVMIAMVLEEISRRLKRTEAEEGYCLRDAFSGYYLGENYRFRIEVTEDMINDK